MGETKNQLRMADRSLVFVSQILYQILNTNLLCSPALCNSLIGLITALFNIYTARSGLWSVTAIVTIVVTGTCTVFMGTMYAVYSLMLREVKMEHDNCIEASV
jgi:hypothetical protein